MRMTCPDCGAEMNHHADKVDYTASDAGVGFDAEVGGVVLEAHTCPECGKTETRAAQNEEQKQ